MIFETLTNFRRITYKKNIYSLYAIAKALFSNNFRKGFF